MLRGKPGVSGCPGSDSARGSGQFGTPWERMHWAKVSSRVVEARRAAPSLLGEAHAATDKAKVAVAMAAAEILDGFIPAVLRPSG